MTGILPDNTQGVREELPVPDNLVGLIIGRGGETIKGIYSKTGAAVFIPKTCDPGKAERVLVVSGTPEQVELAKAEIIAKVQEGIRNLQLKAMQASGLLADPNYYLQYMSSYDPTYAAMYQQMYGQQPVVTTVADSTTLPGTATYSAGSTTNQNQDAYQQQMAAYFQQNPEAMMQYQMAMQQYQMGQMGGMPEMMAANPYMQGYPNQ